MKTNSTTHRITVPTSSIIEGDRIRTDYGDLTALAESIRTEGLIHPIVIDLTYRLIAGGRRFRAMRDILKLDEVQVNFMEVLDDAALRRLEAEENVRRKDMTWQERIRSVKTVHQHQALNAAIHGTGWTQSMSGELLGYSQAHISYALQISTLLEQKDAEITACASFSDAIKLTIKRAEDRALARLAQLTLPSASNGGGSSDRSNNPDQANLSTRPTDASLASILSSPPDTSSILSPAVGLAARPTDVELPGGVDQLPPITVPLSSTLLNVDAIEYLSSCPDASFDHIITDPPYGIDMSNIQQSNLGMDVSSTAAEHDVTSNIALLRAFIPHAFRVTSQRGFLIMWCDYDHWSLLSDCATDVGFKVQRWPLTWVKTSACQNTAAQYNFTKNTEIAIVCRKPSAILASHQSSSYWQGANDDKAAFGHPFAKPINLWRWLYQAVALPGQRVLDPFAGSGTATCAAVLHGLKPTALELVPAHHNNLISNVAATYRTLHPNVQFT